ncbi:hypothetical protein CMI47_10935 [Candidatus Pacearchaeota archaeon]|jgi:hypothetical protein|nr:hypothetical protein [Candidatus Pacearchaeota archaeon]|tara:strand:- start:296 stop:613 length:318 start_codon:yes stop_codon:yes gene_type:complete
MNQEEHHYIVQQKLIIDAWQREEYLIELEQSLRFILIKINWHKNILLKQYIKLEFNELRGVKNSLKTYVNELDEVITEFKKIEAPVERAEMIKNKTIELIKNLKK